MDDNLIHFFVPLIWITDSQHDSIPLILVKLVFNYTQFLVMVVLTFAAIHYGWELV